MEDSIKPDIYPNGRRFWASSALLGVSIVTYDSAGKVKSIFPAQMLSHIGILSRIGVEGMGGTEFLPVARPRVEAPPRTSEKVVRTEVAPLVRSRLKRKLLLMLLTHLSSKPHRWKLLIRYLKWLKVLHLQRRLKSKSHFGIVMSVCREKAIRRAAPLLSGMWQLHKPSEDYNVPLSEANINFLQEKSLLFCLS